MDRDSTGESRTFTPFQPRWIVNNLFFHDGVIVGPKAGSGPLSLPRGGRPSGARETMQTGPFRQRLIGREEGVLAIPLSVSIDSAKPESVFQNLAELTDLGSPEQPLPVRSGKVSVDVVLEVPLQELVALIRTLFFGTVASCVVQLFEFDHLTHKQT